jgi:hypothetical protein
MMKYLKFIRNIAVSIFVLGLVVGSAPAVRTQAAGETITISAVQGAVGQTVTVAGSGFYSSNTTVRGVNIIFGEYPVPVTGSSTTIQTIDYASSIYKIFGPAELTRPAGTFNASFTVPSRLTGGATQKDVTRGTYYIYITYYYPDTGSTTPNGNEVLVIKSFTIVAGSITATPSEGNVGSVVSISGSFFGNAESVFLSYDGTVSSFNGSSVTNTAGAFGPVKFTVPPSPAGRHSILVSGNESGTSGSANFTVKSGIRIFPAAGSPGTQITVFGSGFGASQTVSATFGGDTITPSQTDVHGSFNLPFAALLKPAGSYDIVTTDSAGNTDKATFNLSIAGMNLSASSGKSGTQVQVTGSNFLPKQTVTVTFNGLKVASESSDAAGNLNASFTVPSLPSGSYKVVASDGHNPVEATFSITANAVINPVTSLESPGHVGTPIVITGQGFTVGSSLIVKYDDKQVASVTVRADQSFSATFSAPASGAGDHSVTVSDGANTASLSFIMESSPPAVPAPLKPEMNTKTSTRPVFVWNQVNDVSGVAYTLEISNGQDFSPSSVIFSKAGITTPTYTLADTERLKSRGKDAPYYWHVKAVDGAGNQSQYSGIGSFYVSSFLALSQPVIYILIGAGVVILIGLAFWFGRRTAYY